MKDVELESLLNLSSADAMSMAEEAIGRCDGTENSYKEMVVETMAMTFAANVLAGFCAGQKGREDWRSTVSTALDVQYDVGVEIRKSLGWE